MKISLSCNFFWLVMPLFIWTASVSALSAATLFNIPTGTDPGSCDGKNIDTVITEAALMAQAAINSIEALKSQSIFSVASQEVLNTRDYVFSLFGITSGALGGHIRLPPSQSNLLTKFGKNFQSVVDLLNSGTILEGGKATLACDDTFFKFAVTLADMTPALANVAECQENIIDTYINLGAQIDISKVQGVYYSNFKGNDVIILDTGLKKADGSVGGGFCSATTTKAETWYSYRFILACPAMFNLVPSLAGTAAAQGNVADGTSIEQFLSAPGAFLHEMMHFLGSNTATGKIIDQPGIGINAAYTWIPCGNLASRDASKALTNADSYHYFALASYLGSINWGLDGVKTTTS